MSRKRLLDAVIVLQASRGVARSLLNSQRAQWNVYKRTSSLTSLLARQAGRFAESAQSAGGQAVKSTASAWKDVSNENGLSGKRPLTANVRFESTAARNDRRASKSDDLLESQSHLSPLRAQELQRQAESQIPAQSAEPPPPQDTHSLADDIGEGIHVAQEQDVFYRPPLKSGPVLSALPRVKLPKNTGTTQKLDHHISVQDVNLDVFHSAASAEFSGSSASVEAENLPEETYAALFRSSKNAELLKRKPPDSVPPSTPRKVDVDSSLTATPSPDQAQAGKPNVQPEKETDDLKRLGSDITSDMNSQTLSSDPVQAQGLSQKDQTQFYEMRESRVPASRFGRLWQYGGLATSMAFGAVGEGFRRATGSKPTEGSMMLSANNMERLVAKLSKMRGAALKLGQMMSFQDSKMLPKSIHEVLRRVQDSADFMPSSQRDKVLTDNLGADWRDMFSTFAEKPFAAASIGQVHRATLASSGQDVAVKVQYPGVASSINSDLSNLAILLTASKLLPKGLYLDKTIANARNELAWECDYDREARMGERFRELLSDEESTFFVPKIIKEASGPQVLTAEFCEGTGVTKLLDASQTQKDWIGTNILRLCLREITEFKFMQTDPNWTNFLYNRMTRRLELLDFGAAREYPDKFIVPYVKLLLAASRSDQDAVRELSVRLGYLTGHESKTMVNAHVDSVITLAEPFAENAPDTYDFQDQTITDRVRGLIPVMLRERLSPPPEETYSLHRKLSGAFLLCARLGSKVRCREMFRNAVSSAGVT